MANSTASACPACDCAESPLSIIGDVIGILTFAIASWMSILYYYRSFRDFLQEMHDMQHRVQLAFEETQGLMRKFIERQRMISTPPAPTQRREKARAGENHTGRGAPYPNLVDEAWIRVEREMIKAAKFVNKRLLQPDIVAGVLMGRVTYAVEREMAAETVRKVRKLERSMENLKGVVAEASAQ